MQPKSVAKKLLPAKPPNIKPKVVSAEELAKRKVGNPMLDEDEEEKKPVLKRKAENNNNNNKKVFTDSEDEFMVLEESNKKQKEDDQPKEFLEAYNDYEEITKYFKSQDLAEAKQWLHEQFTDDNRCSEPNIASYTIETHEFGKEENSGGVQVYTYNPEDFLTIGQKESLGDVESLIKNKFISSDNKQRLLNWLEDNNVVLRFH